MKKNYIIIALVLIIILLFTCNGGEQPTNTITKTVTRVDSVRITDTIVKTVHIPIKQAPLIEYIYVNDTVNRYHYGRKDSLASINVYVNSKCRPEKVDIEADINQFIVRDSTYIRDSIHVKEEITKRFLSLGLNLSGSDASFGVVPTLMYTDKKRMSYIAGYDVINNTFMVGFQKKIW